MSKTIAIIGATGTQAVVLGPGLDRLLAIGLPNLPGPWAWAGP
jgi:hypothetical protein